MQILRIGWQFLSPLKTRGNLRVVGTFAQKKQNAKRKKLQSPLDLHQFFISYGATHAQRQVSII
jgi:hypothetical protein